MKPTSLREGREVFLNTFYRSRNDGGTTYNEILYDHRVNGRWRRIVHFSEKGIPGEASGEA